MTTSNTTLTFIRKPTVLARLGLSKSAFYERLNMGLLPPPIALGNRAVGWIEHEINIVLNAMATGISDGELITLIQQLIAKRKQNLKALL
ncbi:helix-turn-helix transcriptional regulator [Shewanella algae]|uniref:helix-turn-helix transcriptional regulator n=1 Tax=Shewanella algae TaxID=38313 RepID=UPI0031F4DB60